MNIEDFENIGGKARKMMAEWDKEDDQYSQNPDYIMARFRAKKRILETLSTVAKHAPERSVGRYYTYYQAVPYWDYDERWEGPTVFAAGTKQKMLEVMRAIVGALPLRQHVNWDTLDMALDNSPKMQCACFIVRRLRTQRFLAEVQNYQQRETAITTAAKAVRQRYGQ